MATASAASSLGGLRRLGRFAEGTGAGAGGGLRRLSFVAEGMGAGALGARARGNCGEGDEPRKTWLDWPVAAARAACLVRGCRKEGADLPAAAIPTARACLVRAPARGTG